VRCQPPVVLKKRSSTFSFSYLQHLIVLMVGDVFFILYLLNPTLSPQYSSACSCFNCWHLSPEDLLVSVRPLPHFCFFLASISSLSLEMNRISWFLPNNKIIFSIFTLYYVSEMSAVLVLLERWWGTWELLSSKNCFRQLHFFSAAIGCHVIRSVVSRLWLKCCKLSGPLARFFFPLGP